MIKLSRLGGQVFYINAELIEALEATPDSVLTLVGGKTIMVREPVAVILRRILRYRRRLRVPLPRRKQQGLPASS